MRWRPVLALLLFAVGCATPAKDAGDEAPEPKPAPEAVPEPVRRPPAPPEPAPLQQERRPPAPPAFKATGVSPREIELGRGFLPLASRFGFTEYVHASRAVEGAILFEYLPKGEALESWNHLGSLLLLRVAGTWEEGAAALPRYRDEFLRSIPEVEEAEPLPGRHGGATLVRYRVSAGPSGERALAAVWQALPGALATFQVLQRQDPFSERQVAEFREVVSELVRAQEVRVGDPELQAKVATRLWTNACLEHLGDFAAQSAFARQGGLRPAAGAFTSAALQGADGEAWLATDQTGEYVLLLTKPDRCAVWARSAGAETVNAQFESLLAGLERQGLQVERQHDREVDGSKARFRQVVYFAAPEGSPTGFVFIASTTSSDAVSFQARLTAGRARRPEQ